MLITGGSGFIGQKLAHELLARGDQVTVLTRDPRKARAHLPAAVRCAAWDPDKEGAWFQELEVVDAVTSYGFPKMSVYSTCRPLADPDFRREFLRRAPAELMVTVPLYGVTAATHDAVTNTPGSFADAHAAFVGLLADAGPSRVAMSTVVVRQNLHELTQLAALARAKGVSFHPHLPYPMRQTTRDPYADSALRESDIVEHFVTHLDDALRRDLRDHLSALGNLIPHPCLLWRAERKHRLPVFGARAVDAQLPLTGTEYRSTQIAHGASADGGQGDAFAVATVSCPHATRCALAPVCPTEHYRVYESLYGLAEFEPVRVAELYESAPVRGAGGPQTTPRSSVAPCVTDRPPATPPRRAGATAGA